jgi:hypothetical protein
LVNSSHRKSGDERLGAGALGFEHDLLRCAAGRAVDAHRFK